ncbi:MAG TPA: hypothetical protein VKP30_33075 [Polyangiaceae bacterium]|nr:hypothetical protein [Polyangiaceae bacterium]
MTSTVFTPTTSVGIVGHGVYFPRSLLQPGDCTKPDLHERGRTPAWVSADEDAITIVIEASQKALACAGISAGRLSAIWLEPALEQTVTERSDATLLAQSLGAGPNLLAADVSPPCNSGSAALQAGFAFVGSGMATHVLAACTGRAGNALHPVARLGSAAFVLGPGNEAEAVLEGVASLVLEFDGRARGGDLRPEACRSSDGAGRLSSAAARLMQELDLRASDVGHAVFHRASERAQREVWKGLGFAPEQVAGSSNSHGVPEPNMGWGLCDALDVARPGSRILCVSHTETTSHALLLRATERSHSFQRHGTPRFSRTTHGWAERREAVINSIHQ